MLRKLVSLSTPFSPELQNQFITELVEDLQSPRKVLVVVPDFTRVHSGAGELSQILFELLKDSCEIDFVIALGTHSPMTKVQINTMFGTVVPGDRYINHNWRDDITHIGQIPSDFIEEISLGKVNFPIDVAVNRILVERTYDIVFSIGQVVPHEVVGMANGNKNLFVGLGGSDMINKSHFIGAITGIEKTMGRKDTPVRKILNYVEETFLRELEVIYLLTVVKHKKTEVFSPQGLFAGHGHRPFTEAADLSKQINIKLFTKALEKVVVYLDPHIYKSTWVGNKAIYRTRMALADQAELVILAPGLKGFGEDPQIDQLIRKYGYITTKQVLGAIKTQSDLQNNLSVAAHLIHGSPEDRFRVTYCPGYITQKEITQVKYQYADLQDSLRRYNTQNLIDGYNTLPDGELIFYVSNPSTGLWSLKDKFQE